MTTPSRSGVFSDRPDAQLEAFAQSIDVDRRLYRHDIRASIVHARMLARVGLLDDAEAHRLVEALQAIEGRIERGAFAWRAELEDIHMHIEHALIEELGDLGRKLHTGRSRNDQVTTATRLWLRDAIDQLDAGLARLQRAFLDRCEPDFDVIRPAYTHLRRAQPVLASHYWLAYIERLQRDRDRLADARRRVNICPLGTAALAGSTLPLDRAWVAKELGFDGVAANSLDASGDRDFIAETLATLSLLAIHLSGWADEWILWSSPEFGFLRLPQSLCTGSSIMPQKINPDALELIRGKSGRVLGALQTILVLLKGLPLAYHRDYQEDKPPLFDAVDTVTASVAIAVPLVRQAELDRASIQATLESGFLDATALMEWFIRQGVPQRTAHHAVGRLVREAMQRGVALADLPQESFQQATGLEVDDSVYAVLGTSQAVQAYQTDGSSSPESVRREMARWAERLADVC